MKSAKEMFSELGFEYSECYFEGKLDSILYKGKQKRHTQVEFMLDRKLYKIFFETCTKETYDILPSCVDIKLHKAINKQVEELWGDDVLKNNGNK